MRSDREERGERGKKKISVRFPDTLPLGPQPTERLTRGAMRWYWTSLVDGPMPLRLLAAGDGSSCRGQPAASPPFPAPPPTWRMAAGSGPLANGADSSAPSRMAATPPRPRSTAASFPSHLFFFCSSTTASGSHWRSPPLPAARSPQHRDPTHQRGLSDSVSLLHPGLRHQMPGPLSSSTVVTPPFIPSEAPPWDSRPVSGAGVVHYHSLHRPRSVPTALGPAPLVTPRL